MTGVMRTATITRALGIAARSVAQQSLAAGRPTCRAQASSRAAAVAQQRTLAVVVTSPTATQLLGGYFASELQAGDCYLLYGSVGSGKSYFCRQFIRAACGDEDLAVPSPTFLLQNIYEQAGGPPIHHFDLYRLTAPHDLLRLDLPASLSGAVSLIEWAERLEDSEPEDHLAVQLQVLHEEEQAALQQRGLAPRAPSDNDCEPYDTDDSGDLRWRRVVFSSSAARWQQRLEALRPVLEAHGADFGCWVAPLANPGSRPAA